MEDRDTIEPQERRPPLYNPEDYVTGLKKFSRLTGLQLYLGEMEVGGGNNKAEPNPGHAGQNNLNNRCRCYETFFFITGEEAN